MLVKQRAVKVFREDARCVACAFYLMHREHFLAVQMLAPQPFQLHVLQHPKPVRASMLRQAELSQGTLILTGTPSSLNTYCANRACESPAYTA